MANKNTKTGGVDNVNGDIIDANDVNDTNNVLANVVGADLTGGSILNSTTQTLIGEVTLTADTAVNGVIIMATGKVVGDSTGGSNITGTVRLYSGTNTAFSSNTVRKTITRFKDGAADDDASGWAIFYVLTSEEVWTSDVKLQITGQCNIAGGSGGVYCESVVVLPIGGAI